ncbi:hypothetical protein EIC84_06840 [Comamonas sp. A23]|nr:hypothetical protein EIC84_06840 [Comamonas sp. A23]
MPRRFRLGNAPSPSLDALHREGDDTFAARRLMLGISGLSRASLMPRRRLRVLQFQELLALVYIEF